MSTATLNRVGSMRSLITRKRRPSGKRVNQHQGLTIKNVPLKNSLLRVMVVDDDKDTVDSMSMLVELWGHDVQKAYNATTALELASTYRPHVLLMDIAMPGMNGCDLAIRLRQLPYHQKALMVAITGCTSEEHRALCNAAGFDYFFLKPMSTNIVERLLFIEQERLAKPPVTLNLTIQKYHTPLQLELRTWVSDCVGASSFHAIS